MPMPPASASRGLAWIEWRVVRAALRPDRGAMMPARILSSVDLPAPFSPTTACASPDWRPRTKCRAAPARRRTTCARPGTRGRHAVIRRTGAARGRARRAAGEQAAGMRLRLPALGQSRSTPSSCRDRQGPVRRTRTSSYASPAPELPIEPAVRRVAMDGAALPQPEPEKPFGVDDQAVGMAGCVRDVDERSPVADRAVGFVRSRRRRCGRSPVSK